MRGRSYLSNILGFETKLLGDGCITRGRTFRKGMDVNITMFDITAIMSLVGTLFMPN